MLVFSTLGGRKEKKILKSLGGLESSHTFCGKAGCKDWELLKIALGFLFGIPQGKAQGVGAEVSG